MVVCVTKMLSADPSETVHQDQFDPDQEKPDKMTVRQENHARPVLTVDDCPSLLERDTHGYPNVAQATVGVPATAMP